MPANWPAKPLLPTSTQWSQWVGMAPSTRSSTVCCRQTGSAQPLALGILPAGTANVLARDLGLPTPLPGIDVLPAAARLLAQSTVMAVDVGRVRNAAGERLMVCWAGVGLDAAVTAQVMENPQAKRRLGALYFAASAVQQVGAVYRAPVYTVTVDGKIWQGRGVLAVASNIQRYAVIFEMAPTAAMNDGLLDLTFFHNVTIFNGLGTLLNLGIRRHINDPNVAYVTGARITIETESPQPVHVDAEPFGQTPVTIDVMPGALPLLVPPTVAAHRLIPQQVS